MSSAEADSGIGGRPTRPLTSMVASGFTGARSANAASMRCASSIDVTLTSTRMRVSAGTTLSAEPECATVGVTVDSCRSSANSAMLAPDALLQQESSRRDEVRVRHVRLDHRSTSKVPVPFRPVFSAPPSPLGSNTSTVPHATARSSRSDLDVVDRLLHRTRAIFQL